MKLTMNLVLARRTNHPEVYSLCYAKEVTPQLIQVSFTKCEKYSKSLDYVSNRTFDSLDGYHSDQKLFDGNLGLKFGVQILYEYVFGTYKMHTLKIWDREFEGILVAFDNLDCNNCTNVWVSSGPDSNGTKWEIITHKQ